jgi:hypothetical protein
MTKNLEIEIFKCIHPLKIGINAVKLRRLIQIQDHCDTPDN